jgi:hypothetical protein
MRPWSYGEWGVMEDKSDGVLGRTRLLAGTIYSSMSRFDSEFAADPGTMG